jgi:hypothetical protein
MDENGKNNHKQNFFKKYNKITELEYKLEMLWSQRIIQGKMHRIRVNITRLIFVVSLLIIITLVGLLLILNR